MLGFCTLPRTPEMLPQDAPQGEHLFKEFLGHRIVCIQQTGALRLTPRTTNEENSTWRTKDDSLEVERGLNLVNVESQTWSVWVLLVWGTVHIVNTPELGVQKP